MEYDLILDMIYKINHDNLVIAPHKENLNIRITLQHDKYEFPSTVVVNALVTKPSGITIETDCYINSDGVCISLTENIKDEEGIYILKLKAISHLTQTIVEFNEIYYIVK